MGVQHQALLKAGEHGLAARVHGPHLLTDKLARVAFQPARIKPDLLQRPLDQYRRDAICLNPNFRPFGHDRLPHFAALTSRSLAREPDRVDAAIV